VDINGITIARNIDEKGKTEVARICLSAFRKKFRSFWLFDGDEERIVNYLKDTLNYDSAFYAYYMDELIGYIGLELKDCRFKRFRFGMLKKHYGFFGGLWRYIANVEMDLFIRHPAGNEIHVDTVAVSEKSRGKGAGNLLLDAAFEYGRELRKEKATLQVVDINPGARKLYEKKGFVVNKVKNYGVLFPSAGFRKVVSMYKIL